MDDLINRIHRTLLRFHSRPRPGYPRALLSEALDRLKALERAETRSRALASQLGEVADQFRLLEAERDAIRGRLARLEAAFAMDTPYPLLDVLIRLADAADHLHADHNCDADGWETAREAVSSARKIVANLITPEVSDG
jgi:hypothetical protein